MGRPTTYSPEVAEAICKRLVGGESLRSICRDEAMPCASTVCLWLTKHPEFSEHYAMAQSVRATLGFDDIQEVADNGMNDWMAIHDPDNPGYRVNGEHINRSRLRVDTMKWRLARMDPKKYGEKIETTLRTNPKEPVVITSDMDANEAARLYQQLIAPTDE